MSQTSPPPPGFTLDQAAAPTRPPAGFVLDTPQDQPINVPPPPAGFNLDQGTTHQAAMRRYQQLTEEYDPPGEEARSAFIDQRWEAYVDGLALANAQRPGASDRGRGERVLSPIAEGTINLGRGLAGLVGADVGDAADFRERNYEGLNLGPDAYSRFAEEHGAIFDRQFSVEAEYNRRRKDLGQTLFDNLRRNQPDANDQELYAQVHDELARMGYQPDFAGQLATVTGTPEAGPEFERSLAGEAGAGVARAYGRISTGGAGMVLGTLSAIENEIAGRGNEQGYGYFEQLDASTSNFHQDLQHSLRASDVATEFNPGSARWWIANASEQGPLMASFIANPAFGTVTVSLAESSAYHDLKAALIDRGYTEDEARIRALGGAAQIGATNALLDRVGFGKISQAAQGGLRGGMASWVGRWLVAGAAEGATEAAQEFNQLLTQYGINADDPDMQDIQQIIAAGGTGALMGLLFGGVGQAATNVLDRGSRNPEGAAEPIVSAEALDAQFRARMEQAGLTAPPAAEHGTGPLPRQGEDPNTNPVAQTDPGPEVDNSDPNYNPQQSPESAPEASEFQGPATPAPAPQAQPVPSQPIPRVPTSPQEAQAARIASIDQMLSTGINLVGKPITPETRSRMEADRARLAAALGEGSPAPQAQQPASPATTTPPAEQATLSSLEGLTSEEAVQAARDRGRVPRQGPPLGTGRHTVMIDELTPSSVVTGVKIGPERVDHHRNAITRKLVPLQVVEEADGALVVMDGNHRLLAKALEGENQVDIFVQKSDAPASTQRSDSLRGVVKPPEPKPEAQGLEIPQGYDRDSVVRRQLMTGVDDDGNQLTIEQRQALTKELADASEGGTLAGIFGQEVEAADLPGPPRQVKTDRPKKRSKEDTQDDKIRKKFSKTKSGKLFDSDRDDPIKARAERAWEDDDGKTVTVASLPPSRVESEVRRTPAPELVKLAEQLLGAVPVVNRRLRTAFGVFRYNDTTGQVEINPVLGKDPRALAKTLAHEIGHAIDWLPDKTLKRGNLLGRLKSLKGYLKKTLDGLNEKEIRGELYELSQAWRGEVNEDVDPPSYVKYRKSSSEIYADFLSVMLNDPALAKRKAPKSFRAFIENIDGKPEVTKAYLDIQDLLNGHPEDVIASRRADIREDFEKGKQVLAARAGEIAQNKQDLWSMVLQTFIDSAQPFMKVQKDLQKAGIKIQPENNIDLAADEFAMMDQETSLLIHDIREAIMPATKAGVTLEDIGEFIMMNRIASGDRAEYINPRGHNPETAQAQIDNLLQVLGPEKASALEEASAKFLDFPYKMAVKLHREGALTDDMMEAIRKNRGKYATFVTLDHLDTSIPAGIRRQIGTFGKVANPLVTTVMKMMSQARLYEVQKFRNNAVKLLKQDGAVEKLDVQPGHQPPPAGPNLDNFAHLEGGKLAWYQTHEMFVKGLGRTNVGDLSRLNQMLSKATFGIWHKVFVQLNMSWLIANVAIRDPLRTYKNLKGIDPKVSLLRVYLEYIKAAPAAWRKEHGVFDDDVRRLMENRGLSAIQVGDFQKIEEQADYDKLIIQEFGGIQEGGNALSRTTRSLLSVLPMLGNVTETMGKVAGDRILANLNIPPRERAHVIRNNVGTPNIYRKGTVTSLTNTLWMYSKVAINGYRSDFKVATDRKTWAGWWLGHMIAVGMPKMLMWAAANGMMGSAAEEWFKKVPDYDRMNYLVIPLGNSPEGKARYLRLPMDHTDLLVSGMMWRTLDTMKSDEGDSLQKDLEGLFHFGKSQIPSLSPPLEIASAWSTYLGGSNPYDDWQRRPILTPDQHAAGGMYSGNAMIQWTADQFGVVSQLLDVIPYFGYSGQTQAFPGTTGTPLSRFLRESDRGLDQERWAVEEVEEQEAARFRLSLPKNVRPLLQERNRLLRFDTGSQTSELSVKERRRRAQLNAYYRDYLKLTAAIKAAEDRGEPERAQHLRDRLRVVSERFTQE